MNMRLLNNVTPIKQEHTCSYRVNTIDDPGYCNMRYWPKAARVESHDHFDSGVTATTGLGADSVHVSGANQLSSSVASTPIRKTLYASCAAKSNNVRSLSRLIDDKPQLATMQNGSQGQPDSLDFFNGVWSSIHSQVTNGIEITPPVLSFTESSENIQNDISINVFSDLLSTLHDPDADTFPAANNPSTSGTNATAPSGKVEGNGYQCPPAYSYSTDLSQHNIGRQQATSLPSLVATTQQPTLVHQQNIAPWPQSSSPNNVDGTSSTHGSPYTPSPNGAGYEYPTSPQSVKPSIPSSTDYPGEYDFQINFGEATVSAPKSAQYTYSPSLTKLFVKMNVTCPIRFKCNSYPPMNCVIRAVPVFKRAEHVTDVVTRCPNHKIPDEVNYVQPGHLIRAEMPDDSQIRYDIANDGRESVSVFYERPQVGAEYTTVLYKFMCLSSCVGGINRRPLLTVFTLEAPDGQVLGRRVVEVRICSCPGRDRAQEEKKQNRTSVPVAASTPTDSGNKRPFTNLQTTMEILQNVQGKRRRVSSNTSGNDEEFTLTVRGRENYELLKKVKEALEFMGMLSADQVSACRRRENEEMQTKQETSKSEESIKDRPISSIRAPSHKESTSPIATSFTVSDPLPPSASSVDEATLDDTQPFSLTPSHSSHPLTVTPTGEPPCTTPTTYHYQVPHSFGQPSNQYWTVEGAPDACDVPDGNKPASTNFVYNEQPCTSSGVHRHGSLHPPITSALLRDSSGASTISLDSNSPSLSFGPPRHVTRVQLCQTISLNRESSEARRFWSEIQSKATSNDKDTMLMTPEASTVWSSQVKTEKKDEITEKIFPDTPDFL